jgi:hypothetical protein
MSQHFLFVLGSRSDVECGGHAAALAAGAFALNGQCRATASSVIE